MSSSDLPHNAQKLKSALEELYRTFSMPPPQIIEGCACCIETRGVDVLLTTPLRELTGDSLWRYVSGVFLTVGADQDFRYLLPRIFELSALTPYEVPDAEIVIGKLARAEWACWQNGERVAVAKVLEAWFEYALEVDRNTLMDGWPTSHAESVLCGTVYAGLPITDMLTRLTEPRYEPVLGDLIERYPNEMSAFWEDAPGGLNQVSVILAKGNA